MRVETKKYEGNFRDLRFDLSVCLKHEMVFCLGIESPYPLSACNLA